MDCNSGRQEVYHGALITRREQPSLPLQHGTNTQRPSSREVQKSSKASIVPHCRYFLRWMTDACEIPFQQAYGAILGCSLSYDTRAAGDLIFE